MANKKRSGTKNNKGTALAKADPGLTNALSPYNKHLVHTATTPHGEQRVREVVYPTGMCGQIFNDTPIIECLWPGSALPPNPRWPREQRFEITAIPGRGEGMRATADIAPGEAIVVEYPILAIPASTGADPAYRKQIFDMIFERVRDAEHRAELYGLANCKPPEACPREEGIVRTNGIGIQLHAPPGTSELGRTASAVFLKTFTLTLHAVKPIRAGEEITITYISTLASSRADRRKALKERYLFHCECPGCALPTPKDVKASDSRRTALENWDFKRPPLEIRVRDLSKREHLLIDYKLSVAMYEKEGLQGYGQYPAQILKIAFIYARTADLDNFRIWMKKAMEVLWAQQEKEHLARATSAIMDPQSFALWGVDLRV